MIHSRGGDCFWRFVHQLGLASALGFVLSGTAIAEEFDYQAFSELFGEPVTKAVTGTPMRISESPLNITVITRKEIEMSPAPDIAGLLRHEAGVSFSRRTIGQADIGIRGYNQPFPRGTLVLVNGRQVYLDHFGSTDWEAIPIQKEEIRQIEIIRGPNGALYGFNAASGVINIVTVNPLFYRDSFFIAEAGTQDWTRIAGGVTLPLWDRGGWRISGGREQSAEFDAGLASTAPSVSSDRERLTINSDAAIRIDDLTTARLEVSYSDVKHSSVGPFYSLSDTAFSTKAYKGDVSRTMAGGSLGATFYINTLKQGALSNEVWVGQLEYLRKLGARHTIRVSSEYRDNTTIQDAPGFDFSITYKVLAGALLWDWNATDSLTLINAARIDDLALRADQAPPPGTPYTSDDYDRNITKVSFNSAALWSLSESDQLRFTVAKGVQIPSLVEFGLAAGIPDPSGPGTLFFLGGNPSNKVTTVWNYELGWRHSLSGWRSTFDAVVFYAVRDDIVSAPGFVPDAFGPGPIYLFTNRGDNESKGVKLAANGQITDAWHWSINYLNLDINDDFNFAAGAYPTDFEHAQPRHVVNAALAYARGPFSASVAGHYQTETQELAIGTTSFVPVDIAPYFDLEARLGYQLTDNISVAISGTGLTDDAQRQTSVGEVERRVFVTLRGRL